MFHPWDPAQMKCSTTGSIYYPNTSYGNNCVAAYGNNFYYNGQSCVERNLKPQANYYGNPYNGGIQQPVYGNLNYQNLANISNSTNYNYNNQSWYNNLPNTNNNVIVYGNQNYNNRYYTNNNCPCGDDNYFSPGIKKTNTTTYIITTTISQPKGTPIYLGNLNNNYGYLNYNNQYYYGNDYNTGYNYYNDYLNYNDYLSYGYDNSYYGNDYSDYYNSSNNYGHPDSYFIYGPSGYYDQNGVYHY